MVSPDAGGERECALYGWEAVAVQDQESWTLVRSVKRALRTAGPQTEVQFGRRTGAAARADGRDDDGAAYAAAGALESWRGADEDP